MLHAKGLSSAGQAPRGVMVKLETDMHIYITTRIFPQVILTLKWIDCNDTSTQAAFNLQTMTSIYFHSAGA